MQKHDILTVAIRATKHNAKIEAAQKVINDVANDMFSLQGETEELKKFYDLRREMEDVLQKLRITQHQLQQYCLTEEYANNE